MKAETTLLVIEDNPEMLANIVDILELAHYKVVTAKDGRTGVAAANECDPDLIICDIMMPTLDGYSVKHLLSKSLRTSEIPFIFLSAKSDRVDFRKAMNLGACDYITKPFDGLELLNVIELRINKNRILNTYFHEGVTGKSEILGDEKTIKEFERLAKDRVLRKYRKRDVLFVEGEKVNEVFYIQSGKVKTCTTNQEGKELILDINHKGDFLGYIPVIGNTVCHESAIAMEESLVYVIPKQDFLELVYSNRDVAKKMIRLLANKIQLGDKRLLDMAYLSVRQKVASALIKLSQNFLTCSSKEKMILFTRKDISNLIGTAIESLNRTLSDFRDEGLIDLKGDGIIIIDQRGIEAIVK